MSVFRILTKIGIHRHISAEFFPERMQLFLKMAFPWMWTEHSP